MIVKLKTEYFQWNGVEHAWGRLFCLILFNTLQRKAMAFPRREKDQKEKEEEVFRYEEGKKAGRIGE